MALSRESGSGDAAEQREGHRAEGRGEEKGEWLSRPGWGCRGRGRPCRVVRGESFTCLGATPGRGRGVWRTAADPVPVPGPTGEVGREPGRPAGARGKTSHVQGHKELGEVGREYRQTTRLSQGPQRKCGERVSL